MPRETVSSTPANSAPCPCCAEWEIVGLSFLTKLASGYWSLFDPTNGYTAIHAALVPMLNEKAIGRRYFFESSMLLELSLLRAVVRDVFIPARYGTETSHLSVCKTLRQFPLALLQGFSRRLWFQYFVARFQHRFSVPGRRHRFFLGRALLRCGSLVFVGTAPGGHSSRHRDAGRATGRIGRSTSDPSREHGHSRPTHAMLAQRHRRRARRLRDRRTAATRSCVFRGSGRVALAPTPAHRIRRFLRRRSRAKGCVCWQEPRAFVLTLNAIFSFSS